MAISFKKYIDITSGVGGGASVRERDLITRIFTNNALVPPNSYLELESADEVATYFGSDSEEYRRAVFYFGWISKNISRAKKISFARWVESNTAPRLFGVKGFYRLADFLTVTSGTLTLTLGTSHEFTGLDFSTATSLSDVATTVQTAIRTQTGDQWANATVTYDAINQRFVLVGGEAVEAEVNASGDVANLLGWGTGAIYSDGALAQSVTDTLIASADASNNFGSFLFIPQLTDEQIIELAQWNDTQNVMYMYLVRCTADNAETLSAALIGYSGTSLTLAPLVNEYDEMIPGIILAATDYSKQNSSQNYMFQQFPELTPKVTTTALSNTYDDLRVNYYGQTQTAGQRIAFYQRGVMMGGSQDLVDHNVYGNETWLKDATGADIMSLLLSVSRVPANDNGRSQLLAIIQNDINQALFNGTISVGKALTQVQKLYITEITGDELAWHQVENVGYWLDCEMQSYTTTDGRTEFKAVYTLIYSKDDAIRKVEGTHTLI